MKNTTKKANYRSTGFTPSNSTGTLYETSTGLHISTQIGAVLTSNEDTEYVSSYTKDSCRPRFIIQIMEQEKALWL